MTMARVASLALVAVLLVVGLMAWGGRYESVPMPDKNGQPGVARTDRLTGAVSFCFPKDGAVNCIDQR